MTWLACSSPTDSKPVEAEDDAPLLIELGTGEWEWEPISDGGELPVIQGPQGGFHFLASVRVSGIVAGSADDLSDPRNPTTTFWVLSDDENLAPSSRFIQGLDEAPESAQPFRHEMVGRFVIMDIASDDELDGVEVELGVQVEDVEGEVLSESMMLTAYPHPFNH